MAAITLPTGAFAAMKSGAPQPAATPAPEPKAAAAAPTPKAEPKADPKPEPDAKAPEGMTAAEKKIWKLKADGEEFDFDATDEEAVKREIMKARGADKRFQSAAALKKQAETFFEMIKNPATLKQVLADPRIGVDVKKFAEECVWEQIQQQKREAEWEKNPELKAQWERDQRLKVFEEKEARDAEAKAREKLDAESARYEGDYGAKIMQALKTGGLPQTPEAVSRMAEYLAQAVEKGYDLSADDLVAQVRADYQKDILGVLGGLEGDDLLALLGESNAKKLRDADLKRLRTPQDNPFPARSGRKPSEGSKKEAAPKRLSGSDWRAELTKDFLGQKK